uniref:Uncharacterized protein n=1 Tax=Romanomermis culicivorax TaxID=13658 RepID=A0A915HXX9_ROMCU
MWMEVIYSMSQGVVHVPTYSPKSENKKLCMTRVH